MKALLFDYEKCEKMWNLIADLNDGLIVIHTMRGDNEKTLMYVKEALKSRRNNMSP